NVPPAPPAPGPVKKPKKAKKPPVPPPIDDQTIFDDEKWDSLMHPLSPGETESQRIKSIRQEAAQKASRDIAEMEAIRNEAVVASRKKMPKLTAADVREMEAIRDEAVRSSELDINQIKKVRNEATADPKAKPAASNSPAPRAATWKTQPKSEAASPAPSEKKKKEEKGGKGLSAEDAALMKQLREQALRGEMDDLT
ncbi:MAG: hypothetical protein Q8P67_12310, partial [archaeon]|nr:hypothetical protein [archaeon]